MRRYALRYLPLLIIGLLLWPFPQEINHSETATPSANNGDFPIEASPFTAGSALYGLAMPSAQDVWAVGGVFKIVKNQQEHLQKVVPAQGQILHYQNGSWLANTSLQLPLLAISMSSVQDGWAAGYGGQLAHYDGHAWQAMKAPTNAILCSVAMLSAREGWAVGFNGTILHFHDQRWELFPTPTTVAVDLLSVKMVSAQEGWAVGRNGTILHYSQQRWQLYHSPTDHTLNGVSFLSPDEGWAVGNQGVILHYRDGVWSTVRWFPPDGSTLYPNLLDVAITSEHTGWIVGVQSMLTYDKEVWQSIAITSEYTGWIVKDQSRLTYNKEVWQAKASGNVSPGILYAIVMNASNEGWAVGDNNSIYHYRSGSWQLTYAY
ncbi:WD40/YVTN/BNR-like repeat-containing protein [Dictyobacter arantiisoli]|uniref:Photosynthesis system II assembly factor Ycf48/Hcf136-like domain-containing protein n=1 Tax=Dictyobacter arantiisoli TaxID=2014874 RepID=A0A5A5T6I9_9CHLR|nr:YCF48-related protein [Dictyobacter arantiisoli]GCF07002.1 hypothetical protein KDI_05660 [Dictyobacter arantiisoli]